MLNSVIAFFAWAYLKQDSLSAIKELLELFGGGEFF